MLRNGSNEGEKKRWQGREADHSPPTSAEVKKMWIYTSTPPLSLHGVVLNLLSTRDNFTFYLTYIKDM
jgi:hypothetical protein